MWPLGARPHEDDRQLPAGTRGGCARSATMPRCEGTPTARTGERRLDGVLATLRRRRVDRFIAPGSVLVDLGCGHAGSLLEAYSDTIERGIGFDVSVGPTPAGNVELHAQAVDAPLPLPDSSVDVVSCLAVIEHVDRPDVLAAEAQRILQSRRCVRRHHAGSRGEARARADLSAVAIDRPDRDPRPQALLPAGDPADGARASRIRRTSA